MKIIFFLLFSCLFFGEKDLFYIICIATSFNTISEQLEQCVLQWLVPKGKKSSPNVISQKTRMKNDLTEKLEIN